MSSLASLAQAEARARLAEARIQDETGQDVSLAATISAVELYMKALSLANNASERRRLDGKCKELLSRAERLKKASTVTPGDAPSANTLLSSRSRPPISTRELSTREKIILLEGAKLNGFIFKAWEEAPSPDEFAFNDGDELFSDEPALSLSDLQVESFAGWKRPEEALASLMTGTDGKTDAKLPTMVKGPVKIDLVQDMTSDCSVVASLCAGTARAERGHGKVSATVHLLISAENVLAATNDSVSL
jgi:calpain-7